MLHVYSFAAVARCDALRFLSVYTMALCCAFELLFFTQDRPRASIYCEPLVLAEEHSAAEQVWEYDSWKKEMLGQ